MTLVEIVAMDSLFPGLASQPLTISIVEELFSLRPVGDIILQSGGTVTIEAVGGSGVYGWMLSDDTLASMEGFGTSRTFSSQSASGEFQVEVWDIVRSDLAPLTATITIGNVPGDVNGDSLVMLDDAIVVMATNVRRDKL